MDGWTSRQADGQGGRPRPEEKVRKEQLFDGDTVSWEVSLRELLSIAVTGFLLARSTLFTSLLRRQG